ILAGMKRRYRSAGFLERCRRIRQALGNPAFSTDVIIGFPGETDADFEATCRVVREVGFMKIHVFSYSPREATAAFDLPDALPPAVVRERRERLRAIERELAQAYFRTLVGRRLDVLVEGGDSDRPGYARGTSAEYAPVVFPGHAPALLRRIVPIRVTEVAGDLLVGEPEPARESTSGVKTFSQGDPRRLAL